MYFRQLNIKTLDEELSFSYLEKHKSKAYKFVFKKNETQTIKINGTNYPSFSY